MGLREWYGDKGTAGQILTAGLFTLIAALIGGAFTLAAAYIHPSVTATETPQAHALITKHNPSYSSSPTPAGSSSPKPPPLTPKPTFVDSPQPKIPVLAPTEQPGWSLAWHHQVLIQSQGMIVGRVGPEASDGSNFDIQYVPDSGWQAGGNSQELDNWPFRYPPGPASIYGYMINGQVDDTTPEGSVGHVGDTIFWANENGNEIAYLDVTGINAQGVQVSMWVWSKN